MTADGIGLDYTGNIYFSEMKQIAFNLEFTQAQDFFRYSWWEHGETFFEKEDGQWVKRYARITAVE